MAGTSLGQEWRCASIAAAGLLLLLLLLPLLLLLLLLLLRLLLLLLPLLVGAAVRLVNLHIHKLAAWCVTIDVYVHG